MKTNEIVLGIVGVVVRVVVLILVVVFIYKGAVKCYDYGYRVFTEPAKSSGTGRSATVTITSDMGARDIGNLLEDKGIINDGTLFALQYFCSEYKDDVEPGTYTLSSTMTAEEIMAAMVPADSTEEETADAEDSISDASAVEESSESGAEAGEAAETLSGE